MNFKELPEPLLSNYFHSESQDSITVNQSNTFNLRFYYESYINNLTEKIKSIDSLPDKLVPKQYKPYHVIKKKIR